MSDVFSEALAHHRAGRLEQAAHLYQSVLAAIPNHADALNLLGVVAHQRGDNANAVSLIEQAIQIQWDRPPYYVNLATALRGLKRFQDAIVACGTALSIQPDLPEAYLNLGLSLQALGRWAEAEQAFRWVMDSRLIDSRGHQALANCYREQGRHHEAVTLYRQALARNPNDGAAHLGLGTVLLGEKHPMAAEPHLRRATELVPAAASAWTNLGNCLIKLARESEAVAVLQRGLELAPNDAGLAVNLGQAYLGSGDTRAAENSFNIILKFHPDMPEALGGLADVRQATDRVDEAIPLYERALQLDPHGISYKGLANALWDRGDVDRAVAVVQQGIAEHPRDPDNHVRLAVLLASGGDLAGAEASYRMALQLLPGHAPALIGLAQTLRAKLRADDVAQLEATLREPIPDPIRAGVHFGLAQVTDGRGEFAAAAQHLKRANALTLAANVARRRVYDPAAFSREADLLIETCTPEFFARFQGVGVDDERPVFIVGMPRSGTTLTEQILASHPKVFGAGERLFAYESFVRLATEFGLPGEPLQCLNRLTPVAIPRSANRHLEQLRHLDGGRAARVVDKMPENYTLLGWLAVQFPNARFIHCRRDVRDVALSCWMTNFSQARWANDLEHIAGRITNYLRVMEHWRRVLPVPLLEVDYEQLVADQEGESRRLVDWLGLEWDPACLTYYRTERLVKTASVTQVRQPIYSRSIGRWEHYREALAPLLQILNM